MFTQKGWTPLHNACREGHEAVARLLLAAGANKEAQPQVSDGLVRLVRPFHIRLACPQAQQAGSPAVYLAHCILPHPPVQLSQVDAAVCPIFF